MPKPAWLLFLLAALLLAAALPARADRLKLKDGRTVEGRIVSEDDKEVKLELAQGSALIFPREHIVEIIREKSSVERLEEKLRALRPARPSDYLETGKWCLSPEIKRDDLGIRLLSTAMALDPGLTVPARLALGDWYLNQKRDRVRAAQQFVRALAADPRNPECRALFEKSKVSGDELRRADDGRLLEALGAARKGDWAGFAEILPSARSSSLRAKAEELLAMRLDELEAYARSRVPCKSCKGALKVACSDCKGTGYRTCKSCGGTGYKKRTSSKGTENVKCSECAASGRFLCTRCDARVTPLPNGTQTFTGGRITCPLCKGGKSPTTARAPSASAVESAWQYLERAVNGKPSVADHAETRMIRVGAAPPVEGAEELLANPVWLGDRWGPADDAEPASTREPEPPVTTETPESAALAKFRAAAKELNPGEADAPGAFLDAIRRAFGTGVPQGAAAEQVWTTDFPLRPAPGDTASSGPWIVLDAAAGTAHLGLAQASEEFVTRRAALAGTGGPAVPLPRMAEWAAEAQLPSRRVRVYYKVTDAQEDLEPGSGRDVSVHRLTITALMVDVMDAAGGVVKSAR